MSAILLALIFGGPSAIDEALTWLPPDTETIIGGSNGTIPDANKPDQLGSVGESVMSVLFLGLPDAKGRDKLPYRFIVNGSRKYLTPKGFGLGPYEGCKIIALARAEFEKMKNWAAKNRKRTEQVRGKTAYVLSITLGERESRPTYSVFDGGTIFCATHKGFLAEVLTRRAKKAARQALPQSLIQWRTVDKSGPFWAIRRFTPESKKFAWGGDGQIVGYGVSMDASLPRVRVVSYSENSEGFEIAKRIWKGMEHFSRQGGDEGLKIRKLDRSATEITYNGAADASGNAMFLVWGALGHVIYI